MNSVWIVMTWNVEMCKFDVGRVFSQEEQAKRSLADIKRSLAEIMKGLGAEHEIIRDAPDDEVGPALVEKGTDTCVAYICRREIQ